MVGAGLLGRFLLRGLQISSYPAAGLDPGPVPVDETGPRESRLPSLPSPSPPSCSPACCSLVGPVTVDEATFSLAFSPWCAQLGG